MKGNKSRFGLRSRLMGTCFSTDNDKIPQEQQQLSSKGNQEAGLGHDRSPTRSNGPEMVEIKRTSSISSIPKNVTDLRNSPGYSNVDIFTYDEMTLATKHFRPDYILGEGGFGVVYKGVLDKSVRPGYKTTYVAIKELNPDGLQGDREWLAEVNYLGQLSHQNLVKLIGYCCEGEHRLLVYEYMASGSLENHLFHRVGCTLTWSKRMKFALDAAKGLASLHGAERSVIYRDFKTSNILLDSMAELAKNIRELKSILYGNSESEPVSEACAQLTQEFFRENTLRLLIVCLPQLNLEARKDATQIVANLQRQQVNSRLIASDYLEKNTDLLDILIAGQAIKTDNLYVVSS